MKTLQSLLFSVLILSSVFTACGQQSSPENISSQVQTHLLWSSLLSDYVDDDGLVDYRGMIKDSTRLDTYLNQLTSNTPNSKWSKDDQLAYWINLYNAATIKLITQHYPINSIKDIGSSIQIPFINTPWQIKFIYINGEKYNLDHIEHRIIRKKFDEPRIHFALVCAARSCPRLRNEAYQGKSLDQQLSDQARVFLADKTKNDITLNHIVISKLFRWYGGDFKKKTTLTEYLNQYSPESIDKSADIDYMDYDWQLNDMGF